MKHILIRFKLAWCAFWLIPVEIQYRPFEYYCDLNKWAKETECDNSRRESKCKNNGSVALAETTVKISVHEGNFYHVCDDCAKKFIGKKEKED